MRQARTRWLLLSLCALAAWAVWFKYSKGEPRVRVGAARVPNASDEGTPSLHANIALLDPGGHSEWEAELITAYGFPWVERVSPSGLTQGDADVGRRWIIPNVALAPFAREKLRSLLEAGAWVIELGPMPGLCGLAATPPDANQEPPSYRLEGGGLAGVRWPVPIATLAGCSASDCPGATVLASARERSGGGSRAPLVIRETRGQGTCIRWLGDFGEAMQRLRQGDPRRAFARAKASKVFKPSDLFADDLEAPDYEIPSADRLGFALASQVLAAPGVDVMLSPLPAASRGLVVFTADQDFVPGMGVLAQSAAMAGSGLTVTLTSGAIGGKPDVVFEQAEPGLMSTDEVSQLAERGHDVGIHPNLIGMAETSYGSVLADHAAAFKQAYGVAPRIVRNHHLVWFGYVEMARMQADAGLALNLDYVTARLATGYFPGFMTGSGLALRMRDAQGKVLPILQLATQIDDYLFLPGEVASQPQALAILVAGTSKLMALSRREHVPITLLHHPAWWHESQGAWQKALLQEAARHGTRVWGAGTFLAFVEESRQTRVGLTTEGFEVVTVAPQLALWVEGAEHWTVNGKVQNTPLTRTLAGHAYQELALPVGRTQVRASH